MADFDPTEHTAAEVHDHLAAVTDPAEYDRIVAIEGDREGGARVTALAGLERPLEAAPGVGLPEGASTVAEAPNGQWERLVDRSGQPVTTADGAQVRLR